MEEDLVATVRANPKQPAAGVFQPEDPINPLRRAASDRQIRSTCCRLAAIKPLVAAIITATLIPALAQEAVETPDYTQKAVTERVRQTCSPEARRLCPSHPLGSNQMVYCMQAMARRISRDCKVALEDDGFVPRGHFRRLSSR